MAVQHRPRPLKTRKNCRWVWLADIPVSTRTKAVHRLVKTEPDMPPELGVELMLLAMNPGDAGGWVAV